MAGHIFLTASNCLFSLTLLFISKLQQKDGHSDRQWKREGTKRPKVLSSIFFNVGTFPVSHAVPYFFYVVKFLNKLAPFCSSQDTRTLHFFFFYPLRLLSSPLPCHSMTLPDWQTEKAVDDGAM
jgi:hypothetical protein